MLRLPVRPPAVDGVGKFTSIFRITGCFFLCLSFYKRLCLPFSKHHFLFLFITLHSGSGVPMAIECIAYRYNPTLLKIWIRDNFDFDAHAANLFIIPSL